MIKLLSGVLGGLLVACGGTLPVPAARTFALHICEGGVVHGDAELAAYQRCALVSGDLEVSGVTNLGPLAKLRAVRGTLSLTNTELETLAGLGQLASVGRLELSGNSHLDSLSELTRLGHAGEIAVRGNTELHSLDGLSGLTELRSLSVQRSALYSLRGLENVLKLGHLELTNNRQLIDPRALNSVRETQDVVMKHNPRLCSQFGLLAALKGAERVAVSENSGLERSALRRLVDSKTQATLAAR